MLDALRDLPSLVAALVVAAAAVVVGDSLAFAAGRRSGERVRASRFGRRVGSARWARADAFVAHHAARAVLLARWVVGLRTLVPRLAASGGMPYGRFVRMNVPSGLAWAGTFVTAGYLAGSSYERVSGAYGRATGAVVALAVVLVVLVLIGRWVGRHPVR